MWQINVFRLAREFALESGHDYGDKLKRIQTVLVDIGLLISQSDNANVKTISKSYTKELEDWINEYSSKLPPVEHFILPVSLLNLRCFSIIFSSIFHLASLINLSFYWTFASVLRMVISYMSFIECICCYVILI